MIGAARTEAVRAYRLVEIRVPTGEEAVEAETFTFTLRKDRLRQGGRSEGHYLLRSNLSGEDPTLLWQYYVRLAEIESVFRALRSDLAIRPIYHQKDSRIEAHIFVSFLAYCIYFKRRERLRPRAPGCRSCRATRSRKRTSGCCSTRCACVYLVNQFPG